MSDSAHLLIPFASSHDGGCAQARSTLALPRLEKLLSRLAPAATEAGEETSLSMPHERVLAGACGLAAPDGRIPWAAWQIKQAAGQAPAGAWALITPCHWRVGSDHVAMDDPQDLQLQEPDARALFAAMQPYFKEDAITLAYDTPQRWLAQGEVFRELATASLDRVIGRAVDAWLPRVPIAGPLRRLQQEMQMLLYTNEVNEERIARGLLPVNSFWISGTGALPPGHAAAPPAGLQVAQSLRRPALQGDWQAWAAAWQQLDANECAGLLQALDAGRPVSLTLSGERSAQTWSSQERSGSWWRRIGSAFAARQAMAALEAL